jgi:AcrR family transcriptional regulator
MISPARGKVKTRAARPARLGGRSKRGTKELAPGRREAKKQENLLRIKTAAQECFISRGFEEVTMREIAARAKVGIGTLFRYAENKHDLLLLAVIDDVEAVVVRGRAAIRRDAPLVKNLMAALRPPFFFFGNPEQPAMSRLMLSELLFYERGALAKRFWASRNMLLEMLSECIEHAVYTGEIERPEKVDQVVWLIHAIYHAELRHSVTTAGPSAAAAQIRLEQSLRLFMRGLAKAPRQRDHGSRSINQQHNC